MPRAGTLAARVEQLVGAAVVSTGSVAGGDICLATRARLSDGRSVLVKTRSQAPPTFFPLEAAGLRWLGEATEAGGVATPEVLAAEPDCLVLDWVEPGRPTPDAAAAFGRALARTHAAGAEQLGTATGADGFIGTLPLPNGSLARWPDFFATRRLLPYLRLARDRDSIGPADAAAVERVAADVESLAGPAEPTARIHGDLWSGNVLWGADGGVRVVDPAAHGGHRESDLALLILFGCPQLQRVLDAYDETVPLAEGWQDRIALHQLFPLLVHACLFGGGYGSRAGDAARSLAAG